MNQLALPPAPEPKLLPGEVEPHYIGMDLGYGESVTMIERFYADGRYECYIGIDPASGDSVTMIERFYADGRYELYIDGKLIPGSIYWHGKPPFVMMNWKEIPL